MLVLHVFVDNDLGDLYHTLIVDRPGDRSDDFIAARILNTGRQTERIAGKHCHISIGHSDVDSIRARESRFLLTRGESGSHGESGGSK